MLDQILEAWHTNDRLTRNLLAAVPEGGLGCTLSTRGGRNVARQFAHVHNNRVAQVVKRGRGLGKDIETFEGAVSPTKGELARALEESASAVEDLFRGIDANEAGCLRKGPVTYLAYFVAHEAHHRGNILLTLKTSGHPVPKDDRYALWGWDQA